MFCVTKHFPNVSTIESRVVIAAGKKVLLFNWSRVSVLQDENSLEVDGGDDCLIMWMYFMPLNCTVKNSYNGKFYIMYILSPFKQNGIFLTGI